MAPLSKRIKERESYNAYVRPAANAGDIEKVDWLQLKYAIVLDATVETLQNINLLTLIDEWWGTGYCLGGSTKNCIDCSAFTNIIMRNVYNVNIPRTAQDQFNSSHQIGMEDLNEGDLVFFHTGGREISHVGVYLQNNKFVHAATSEGVMVSDLNDAYWKGRYKGAGRYINSTATTVR
jgi:lipoprotein Spr